MGLDGFKTKEPPMTFESTEKIFVGEETTMSAKGKTEMFRKLPTVLSTTTTSPNMSAKSPILGNLGIFSNGLEAHSQKRPMMSIVPASNLSKDSSWPCL